MYDHNFVQSYKCNFTHYVLKLKSCYTHAKKKKNGFIQHFKCSALSSNVAMSMPANQK